MQKRIGVIGALSLLISSASWAIDPRLFDEASRYTVKVNNQTASIYNGLSEGGHGTAFIVELLGRGKSTATVFTNRHVVQKHSVTVGNVSVDLYDPNDGNGNLNLQAKVVYVSQIHDFAVMKVDLN